MSIRVALIDDQELFRAGIAMVLRSQLDIELVGQAGDGADALDLVRRTTPDVVLMDVRMPKMDGVTATRLIRANADEPNPKVLILTTFDLDQSVADAIEAGASGSSSKMPLPNFCWHRFGPWPTAARSSQPVPPGRSSNGSKGAARRQRARSTQP